MISCLSGSHIQEYGVISFDPFFQELSIYKDGKFKTLKMKFVFKSEEKDFYFVKDSKPKGFPFDVFSFMINEKRQIKIATSMKDHEILKGDIITDVLDTFYRDDAWNENVW